MNWLHPLDRSLTPPRRIRGAWRCLALGIVLSLPLRAMEPIKTYHAVTLKDGRRFTAVEVISYTSNGVLVRHADGVTTFRRGVLPDRMLADLHLPAGGIDADLAARSWDPSLADKPAVSESTAWDIANRPAIVEATIAVTPAAVSGVASPDYVATNPPAPSATVAATVAPVPAVMPNGAPVPAGEGNIPEFFVSQTAPVGATVNSSQHTIAGRVVVRLPSGEMRLLADVAIKAYPASLLAEYLEKSKARAEREARKLIEQAGVAENAGALAEAQALIRRARNLTDHYLDDLPEPPNSTRSDEFGYFTVRHQLRDARIVASGRVVAPTGTWYYEWIDVVPKDETMLNESNATNVTAPAANSPRYTVR